MIPNLPKRLKAIADMVEKDSVIADIGTDHGYLPAYLINSGIVNMAYAGDVAQGPLNAAKLTMEKYNIPYNKIKLVLSNGLMQFEPDCADTIIIAGMGSSTICDILFSCDWIKNQKVKLLIQSMNQHENMRKKIYSNGFKIKKEKVVIEQGHIYTVIMAVWTGDKKDIDDVFAYSGKVMDNGLSESILYIKHQISRLDKQKQGILKSSFEGKDTEALKIQNIINGLQKLLEVDEKNGNS